MNKDLKQFYKDNSKQYKLSEQASKRVKENIFANLGSVVDEVQSHSFWDKLRHLFLHSYVLVPLIVVLFLAGTTYVSANALPGDTLYSVKRAVEDAQILVAPTEDFKLELQEKFAQKRIDELQILKSINEGSNKKDRNSSEDKNEGDDHKDDVNKNRSESNKDDVRNKSEHNNDGARRNQEKAKDEAEKALDKLRESHQNFERRGDNDRAKQIEERVKQLREELEERIRIQTNWNWDNSGSGSRNSNYNRNSDDNSGSSNDHNEDDNSDFDSHSGNFTDFER